MEPPAATPAASPIEGLGIFYLGRRVDPASGEPTPEPLLLDARRLTTHAVCVGMTGSGKTGLLIDLLEEAALDGIPAVVIDPKGDLANLLLSFPDLAPADFLPWVDPAVARREGIEPAELAARTAAQWRQGLEASGQSPDRIARLHAAAEMAVYTPGSRAGRPLAMLGSFTPPEKSQHVDAEAWRERIEALVSGILALAGIDAAPGTSRDHVLLSAIIDQAWQQGEAIDFGRLIQAIPKPPLERIGFLNLENFYPAADRFALATKLNTVAATPGFDVWLDGEPLDVDRLLWTEAGRPRVSIVSIAHLSEPQRMAFVTLLAGQTVSWMRSQPGTSSLRAIFLMDEVFGYLPPTANPPSKAPLLTMLKQARAYGLGVVLASQNPVDLDYKGLSNTGLWFLGRLQTARDKARVLDGLEGAAAAAGRSLDRGDLDRLLSGLGKRRFLMHSVHGDAETVFETRWTMAYLRGPLLREELSRLPGAPASPSPPSVAPRTATAPAASTTAEPAGGPRPLLPPGIKEVFVAADQLEGNDVTLQPAILGRAWLRFSERSLKVDCTREVFCLAPATDSTGTPVWDAALLLPAQPATTDRPTAARYGSLPGPLASAKSYRSLATSLRDSLVRTQHLSLLSVPQIDAVSEPEETERAFRLRVAQQLREWRDSELDQIRSRYEKKLATAAGRVERARQKLEKEQADVKHQSFQTYVSIGTAILDALLRRRASTRSLGRVATSARSASRTARQQADVTHAEAALEAVIAEQEQLEDELAAAIERVQAEANPETISLERVEVPARKTGSSVEEVCLAWVPGSVDAWAARQGAVAMKEVTSA